VHVKRIHEYKRQLLNLLHVVTLYNRLRQDPAGDFTPRTCIFGGKAAPGYFLAKLIIKLINSVAAVVNADPLTSSRLRLIFLPNYCVSQAEKLVTAADLSEQISTAGMEASGTGNMKFAMNGALTIGTLDGANIEIREAVGPKNFFLFGMTAGQAQALKAGGYRPEDLYHANAELRAALDLLNSGRFARGDRELYRPLFDNLLQHDPYLVLADYASYIACQEKVSRAYRNRDRWVRMSIINSARMGRFSSDRTIGEYCSEIWRMKPVPVELKTGSL
jgi:starch phosphorylase